MNVITPQTDNSVLFSIIMPTYNRANLIGKAIESVLKQSYPHFELIIVNDGGADNTEDIVKKFDDDRISYYWKENEQKGIAKNFGFDRAKGHYVCSFDDDDIMYPNHLQAALNIIEEGNRPEVVYVHYNIISENGEFISNPTQLNGDIGSKLTRSCPLSNNGMFLRKDITKEMRYYHSPDLKLSADWLLWLRLSVRYPINYTNEITHGVVVHPGRGSASAKPEIYIRNKEIFLSELKNDKIFMRSKGGELKYIQAYYDTYIALFLSIQGNKSRTILYFIRGIYKNYREIFRRRTLAIFKYLLLRW